MNSYEETMLQLDAISVCLSSGDLEDALTQVNFGFSAEFYRGALSLFGAHGEIGGMIKVLAVARQVDPSFSVEHDRLVLKLAEVQDQIEQCPVGRLPSVELELKLGKARNYALEGRFIKAIVSCLEIAQSVPNDACLLFLLGILLQAVDLGDQAVDFVLAASKIDPSLVSARYWLAVALRRKAVCEIELLKEVHHIISLHPSNPEPYHTLSELHFLRGNYHEADFWTKAGVEIQSEEARRLGLDTLELMFLGKHWTPPIGHIAAIGVLARLSAFNALSYLPVILGFPSRTGNLALLNYFEQYFPIIRDNESAASLIALERQLGIHISGFSTRDGFKSLYEAWSQSVEMWEADRRPPLLCVSDEHRFNGERMLRKWGVPQDGWFVTVHVRDTAEDWTGRNADINTYLPALKEITSRGGWVIRIGDHTMRELPPLTNVIDYAHFGEKTPELDVFFCGACRFFIGSASGPSSVPSLFDVPVLATNYSLQPLQTRPSFDVFMPKLFRDIRQNRLLTFSESARSLCANVDNKALLARMGIEVVDNTPDEIREAVVEMIQRSEGGSPVKSEVGLQSKLKECLTPVGKVRCDIASSVLNRHRDLVC